MDNSVVKIRSSTMQSPDHIDSSIAQGQFTVLDPSALLSLLETENGSLFCRVDSSTGSIILDTAQLANLIDQTGSSVDGSGMVNILRIPLFIYLLI